MPKVVAGADRAINTLTLKYSGDLASNGEIDAYDLANAIEGFSDFMHSVGVLEFGEDFDLRPSITPFRQGSFEIGFLLHMLSSESAGLLYASIPAPLGLQQFLKLISDTFALLRHLKGDAPKSVQFRDGNAYVENNYGTINQFTVNSLTLVSDRAVGRAARNFVGQPLQNSATHMDVLAGETVVVSASREEVDSFVPIDIGDILAENTNEVHLTVQTAVFEGKTKWKFNDGRNTFSASIEDTNFLGSVARGREAFRKGDELLVQMRATQKRINGQLKAEYVIEKVLRHVPPPPPGGTLF